MSEEELMRSAERQQACLEALKQKVRESEHARDGFVCCLTFACAAYLDGSAGENEMDVFLYGELLPITSRFTSSNAESDAMILDLLDWLTGLIIEEVLEKKQT
jgi:hypothetical protein